MIKVLKKTIVVISLFFLVLAGLIAAAAAYFYFNPEIVAARAGKYLSDSVGLSFTAGRLDWSIRPLHIEAGEVEVSSVSAADSLRVEIPELACRMRLEGPFGNRTLVIDNVKMSGVSAHVDSLHFSVPEKISRAPAALVSVLQALSGAFLFRDIVLLDVSVSEGGLSVETDDFGLAMNDVEAGRRADGEIQVTGSTRIHLREADARFYVPDIQIGIRPGLSMSSMKMAGELDARDASLEIPQLSFSGLSVGFFWDLDLKNSFIRLSDLTGGAGSLFDLDGGVEASWGRSPEFDLAIHRCRADLSEIVPLLSRFYPAGSAAVAAEGALSFSGGISAAVESGRWIYAGSLEIFSDGNRFSWSAGGRSLDGVVSGKARLSAGSGGFPVSVAGDLALGETNFSSHEIGFGDASAGMRFAGTHPHYSMEGLSIEIPRAFFGETGKKTAVEDIRLDVPEVFFNLKDLSVDFSDADFASGPLSNLLASGSVGPGAASFSVRGENTGLISLARQAGVLPAGWEISGVDRVALSAVLNPDETVDLKAEAAFESLAFQDPSARCIGEGVSAEAGFIGRIDLKTPSVNGDISVRVPAGEILLDLFYLDMGKFPFQSEGAFSFQMAEMLFETEDFALSLGDLFEVRVGGTLAAGPAPGADLSFHLAPAEIFPLYDKFVTEPFGRRIPFIDSLQTLGKISADLNLAGTVSDYSVKGRIKWVEGTLSAAEGGIHADHIHMSWPVWFQARPEREPSPLSGVFTIGNLRLPPIPAQSLDLSLEALPNRIRVPSPQALLLPGGKLEPGPVSSGDLLQGDLQVETSMRLILDDLDPLLTGIWPEAAHGTLYGDLGRVVFHKDRVKAEGTIDASVFGGTISISGLEASRLFSPAPLFTLSAVLSEIDLGMLTADTAFGRIEGIMEGYVRNLEISRGQPQRFEMLLETVERSRSGEKISVRAVENISRVGSGASPFVGLAGVLTSFFENLGYSRIGVRATLENDYFHINGTIREDGVEYIMKRSGISGVNIVNQNPDNRIRFQDMVNRIGRVMTEEK